MAADGYSKNRAQIMEVLGNNMLPKSEAVLVFFRIINIWECCTTRIIHPSSVVVLVCKVFFLILTHLLPLVYAFLYNVVGNVLIAEKFSACEHGTRDSVLDPAVISDDSLMRSHLAPGGNNFSDHHDYPSITVI